MHNHKVQDFQLIQTVLVYALPVLFAITLHEAAHGFVAHRLGDSTAWQLGRVTLNPWPHIDLWGTLVMPVVLYLATSGHLLFGYAKPVPIQWGRLRHPRRDGIWVALAGPGANLLQGLLWLLLWALLGSLQVQERFFLEVCKAGVWVNVVIFAFNLFPFPPLDGGRVLSHVLPTRAAMVLARVEPYGIFIILALLLLGLLNDFWMQPVIGLTMSMFETLWVTLMGLRL